METEGWAAAKQMREVQGKDGSKRGCLFLWSIPECQEYTNDDWCYHLLELQEMWFQMWRVENAFMRVAEGQDREMGMTMWYLKAGTHSMEVLAES